MITGEIDAGSRHESGKASDKVLWTEQDVRGGGLNLKTTERFTRVAPDRVHYAFQVEDSDTWVEPWGGEYEFAAVAGKVYEYACHEGNYGLSGILAGGRSADRVKAATGK